MAINCQGWKKPLITPFSAACALRMTRQIRSVTFGGVPVPIEWSMHQLAHSEVGVRWKAMKDPKPKLELMWPSHLLL